MNSIWFPVPVAIFVRRVVNALSAFSITRHYLAHRTDAETDSGDEAQLPRREPWLSLRDLRVLSSYLWPEHHDPALALGSEVQPIFGVISHVPRDANDTHLKGA